jgi:hypothetical protein
LSQSTIEIKLSTACVVSVCGVDNLVSSETNFSDHAASSSRPEEPVVAVLQFLSALIVVVVPSFVNFLADSEDGSPRTG